MKRIFSIFSFLILAEVMSAEAFHLRAAVDPEQNGIRLAFMLFAGPLTFWQVWRNRRQILEY